VLHSISTEKLSGVYRGEGGRRGISKEGVKKEDLYWESKKNGGSGGGLGYRRRGIMNNNKITTRKRKRVTDNRQDLKCQKLLKRGK